MKTNNWVKNLTLGATVILFFCGCFGLNNGQVSLRLASDLNATTMAKAINAATAVDITDGSGTVVGQIELTKILLALSEIELEVEEVKVDDSEDLDEIDFEGPFMVDLFAGTVLPDPGFANIPAGTYNRIDLDLKPIPDEALELTGVSKDSPFYGKSILIEGKYTGKLGAVSVSDIPVHFSCSISEEFEILTGVEGLRIGMYLKNEVSIAFKISNWFNFSNKETNPSGTDFSSAELSAENTIIISESANSDIWTIVKENIKEFAEADEI